MNALQVEGIGAKGASQDAEGQKRKGEAGFITIIYGEDATEEQATMVELEIKEKIDPDIEVALVNGGTPIYYFTISVE